MTTRPYTLLVAEDDDTCAELIEAFLTPLYRLERVSTGDEALACLLSKSYDLALLDIYMPGMTGLEVCRAAKADSNIASVPIIFMTASRDDELVSRCFEAGGVDYLLKPLHDRELLSRIRSHLRIQVLERELRRQIDMRNLMLLSLSHDMRGSIGSVVGFMELMGKEEALSESVTFLSQAATRAARHSYRLLEDTLTWIQALDHQLAFQPVWLSFAPFGQDCLDMVRPSAAQKSLSLSLETESEEMIYADRHLLKMLLHNLLSNAVKFTAQGSVTLRAVKSATGVLIEVADTGRGLPPDVITKLEREQPINPQQGTHGERGTGMGLKICQELASYHHSRLQFRSEAGRGTVISLLLPFPAGDIVPPGVKVPLD